MDTSTGSALMVHKNIGSTMKFKGYMTGLYFYYTDIKENDTFTITTTTSGTYSMLNAVGRNTVFFHRHKVKAADKVQALHHKLECPLEQHLKHC